MFSEETIIPMWFAVKPFNWERWFLYESYICDKNEGFSLTVFFMLFYLIGPLLKT
jgi:hypothetical protein